MRHGLFVKTSMLMFLPTRPLATSTQTLRIATPLAELPWIVLPRLVETAAQLHKELAGKKGQSGRLLAEMGRPRLTLAASGNLDSESLTHGEVSAQASFGWGRRPPHLGVHYSMLDDTGIGFRTKACTAQDAVKSGRNFPDQKRQGYVVQL